MTESRLSIVFLGSGAFGLPTLTALLDRHDVSLVVSQPDRPAGRRRQLTATPIAAAAAERGLDILKPEAPNDAETRAAIDACQPDALVVIAYGHKLGAALLDNRFAINLHASLLPQYRGAAPINRAMIAGEAETGVSIISLSMRIDSGGVYAARRTAIDPLETAGELHDRLSELGPEAVLEVLDDFAAGRAVALAQDESLACPAAKLSKAEGTTDFADPAPQVRARIHGLTPWPGCTVQFEGELVKLLRVRDVEESIAGTPGTIGPDGCVACGSGSLELLEVQPAGRRPMSMAEFRRGREMSDDARFVTR